VFDGEVTQGTTHLEFVGMRLARVVIQSLPKTESTRHIIKASTDALIMMKRSRRRRRRDEKEKR